MFSSYVNFNFKHWLYYFVSESNSQVCGLPKLMYPPLELISYSSSIWLLKVKLDLKLEPTSWTLVYFMCRLSLLYRLQYVDV
jgi:hypothetical protein